MALKPLDSLASVRRVPLETHVLMVLCAVMGLFASPTVDSMRDVYQAYSIAVGEHFPLHGPQLAGSVHVGPAWFYLLAIPALLGDNLHVISVFVFALSGLKFYLAWFLGRQLHSHALGLAFALMVALPSWSSTQLLIWTHTSVLETAILAFLIALRVAIARPRSHYWLVLGLAYSLAIHAHPTAVPFGWLVLFAAPIARRRPGLVTWFLLGLAIPFLPYIASQAAAGFPDATALEHYGKTEFAPGGLSEFARMIYSVVVIGPNLFYRTTLPDGIAPAFLIAHWAIVSAGLAGMLLLAGNASARLRRLAAIGVANLVIVTLFVVLVRGRTPWHLAYASSLCVAFLYAVCWTVVLQHAPKARWALAPAIVAIYAAVVSGAAVSITDSSLRFQEKVFYDVKNLRSAWGPPGLIIPARHAPAHGHFLCSESVALHGPYAATVDVHLAMEAAFECGRRDSIVLGGSDASYRHWAGVSPTMQNALGEAPEKTIGNVALYTPLAIGDRGKPLAPARGDRNPPRRFMQAAEQEPESVSLESSRASALLITKTVGAYLSLDIRLVQCNGESAVVLVESNYAWLYGCRGDDDRRAMSWYTEYLASAPGIVDVVLLPIGR